MTGNRNRDIRSKAGAVLFAFLMVTSMVAVGFAGSAAAVTGTSVNESGTSDFVAVDENTSETYDSLNFTAQELNNNDSGQTVTFTVYLTDGDITSQDGVNTNISSSNEKVQNGNFTFTASPSGQDVDAYFNISSLQVDYPHVSQNTSTDLRVDIEDSGGDNDDYSLKSFQITDSGSHTITVDGDSGEGDYDTIQNAIGAASSGDTIVVQSSSSTYSSFQSSTSDLTITAAEGASPEVVVDSATKSERVNVGSSNTISGLTFDLNGGVIYFGGSDDITFENNDVEISDKSEHGIRAEGSSGVTIQDNEFTQEEETADDSSFSQGILLSGSQDALVEDNTFTGPDGSPSSPTDFAGTQIDSDLGFAIYVTTKGHNPSATIQDNTIDGFGQGIVLNENNNDLGSFTVEDNEVSNAAFDEFLVANNTDSSLGLTLNGESDINAQLLSAYESNNFGADTPDAIIDGNEYAVNATPNRIPVDVTSTITADIAGVDDGESPSVAYEVTNESETLTSSATSGDQFTVDVTPVAANENHTVTLLASGTDEIVQDTSDNVTSDYTVDGLTADGTAIDDATLTYNTTETVNFAGTLVAGDSGVGGEDVDLNATDGTNKDTATTSGDGSFLFSGVTLDDAGTYEIAKSSDADRVYADFTVEPVEATVDFTADAENTAGFNQTYNVTVTDSADNPVDFNNYDGYVNVTGQFSSVESSDVAGSTTNDDGDIVAIHVDPSASGDGNTVEFNATPLEGDDLAASLENNDDTTAGNFSANNYYDGIEDTSPSASADSPDVVGSDSLAVSTSDEELSVSVATGEDDDELAATTGKNIDVTIRGADGNYPDGPADESNDLSNATVDVTGPGVDLSAGPLNGSGDAGDADADNGNPVTFSGVTADEAGNITVDVTAIADDGSEYTASETIPVTGDKIATFEPTSVNIDDTETLSADITNAEDTQVNNRNVTITQNESGAALTVYNQVDEEVIEDVTTLTISGSNGEIVADGTVLVDDYVVNNGAYVAENITFSATGTFDATVERPDGTTTAQSSNAIDVAGIEAYDVESDTTPALAGASEVHNLTITEDGAAVNGSDLGDFSVTQTHDETEDETITSTPVDLNDDGTDDALEVTVEATNASDPVELTVDDGNDRTGTVSIETVAPDVTASVNDRDGDVLTEGLNSTVDYTVEDPRDGTAFDNGDVAVEAVNATIEVDTNQDGSFDTTLPDDEPVDINLDENGQASVHIGVQELADDADSPALVHNARTDAASTGAGDIELPVASPTIQVVENGERSDVPATVAPNSEVDYTFEVVDANDRNLPVDGVTFNATGAGLDQSTELDEGFVDVTGEVNSGEIALTINDDVGDVSLATIQAKQTANLSLTADAETVEQNGSVEFALERSDFGSQTLGQLNITNADGEVVENELEIDATESVTFDTDTYEPGEYTIEATKEATSQKTFTPDTVTVTVEEPAGPEGYAITDVSLDPSTVEPNTTVDHDLSYTVTNASNDGNSDTYTVTLPSAASFEDANSLTVTDANGDEISISSSASFADADDGSNNQLTFGIQPDSSYNTSAVTVDANVTVSFDDVSETTTAPVTLDVSDSTQGDTSAQTDVTIQPAGSVPSDWSGNSEQYNAIYENGTQPSSQDISADLNEWFNSDDGTIGDTEFSTQDMSAALNYWFANQ